MEIATVEAPHIPEKAQTTPSPEFSRRILLGPSQKEALNPNAPLAPITREALGSLKDRDYTLYNTKSDAERDAFWSTKAEKTTAEQMESWLTDTQSRFTNGREFFTSTDQGKQWAALYKQIGLSADNMQRDQLEKFYATYLISSDKAHGGEKKFISDILAAHRTPDGKLDREKLEKNLPAITWLANVYGEKSAQIVTRLTASEGILEANPDEIINNVDTTLSPEEIKLLEFISTEPTQSTAPQETHTDETPAEPATQEQSTTAQPDQTPHPEPNGHTPRQTETTPDTTPRPTEQPTTTVPTHEVDPTKDLVAQVNEVLRAGAQDTIRFEVPPEALTKYLKTMKVSGDIKKMDAHIADGKMVLDGKIGIPFGGIDFKATMVNGPDGKLVIEGVPTITYHGAANFGPVKEKAQATITNIDNKITEEIQSKADSNWDVASTQIVGDKLALEFKKK